MSAFANTVVVLTEFEVGGECKAAGGQEECDSRSAGSGMGSASGMFAFSNIVSTVRTRSQCVQGDMQQHDTMWMPVSPADGAFKRQLSLS